MPTTVEIPNVGEVDFPDSMAQDQIEKESHKLYIQHAPTNFAGLPPGAQPSSMTGGLLSDLAAGAPPVAAPPPDAFRPGIGNPMAAAVRATRAAPPPPMIPPDAQISAAPPQTLLEKIGEAIAPPPEGLPPESSQMGAIQFLRKLAQARVLAPEAALARRAADVMQEVPGGGPYAAAGTRGIATAAEGLGTPEMYLLGKALGAAPPVPARVAGGALGTQLLVNAAQNGIPATGEEIGAGNYPAAIEKAIPAAADVAFGVGMMHGAGRPGPPGDGGTKLTEEEHAAVKDLAFQVETDDGRTIQIPVVEPHKPVEVSKPIEEGANVVPEPTEAVQPPPESLSATGSPEPVQPPEPAGSPNPPVDGALRGGEEAPGGEQNLGSSRGVGAPTTGEIPGPPREDVTQDHGEAVTPLSKPIPWDVGRDALQRDSTLGVATVRVPIADLLDRAQQDINRPGRALQSVPEGGTKLDRAQHFLSVAAEQGKTVLTPEIHVENGRIVIDDGYHRAQAAHDLGQTEIPVRIPRRELGALRALGVGYEDLLTGTRYNPPRAEAVSSPETGGDVSGPEARLPAAGEQGSGSPPQARSGAGESPANPQQAETQGVEPPPYEPPPAEAERFYTWHPEAPAGLTSIERELYGALHSTEGATARWDANREAGLTDEQLKARIAQEFGIQGGASVHDPDLEKAGYRYAEHRGGKNPTFEIHGFSDPAVKPITFGPKALLDHARRILQIPKPGEGVPTLPPPPEEAPLDRLARVKQYSLTQQEIDDLSEKVSQPGFTEADLTPEEKAKLVTISNVMERRDALQMQADGPQFAAVAGALKDQIKAIDLWLQHGGDIPLEYTKKSGGKKLRAPKLPDRVGKIVEEEYKRDGGFDGPYQLDDALAVAGVEKPPPPPGEAAEPETGDTSFNFGANEEPTAGRPGGAEPIRYDPSRDRYTPTDLRRGDRFHDENGGVYEVDRRNGFILSADRVSGDGPKYVSINVDPTSPEHTAEIYPLATVNDAARMAQMREAPKEPAAAKATGAELRREYVAERFKPIDAGRVLGVLSRPRSFEGKIVELGKEIEQRVADGWTVETTPKGERRFTGPDGRFLDQKAITRIGMDFADWTAKRNAGYDQAELDAEQHAAVAAEPSEPYAGEQSKPAILRGAQGRRLYQVEKRILDAVQADLASGKKVPVSGAYRTDWLTSPDQVRYGDSGIEIRLGREWVPADRDTLDHWAKVKGLPGPTSTAAGDFANGGGQVALEDDPRFARMQQLGREAADAVKEGKASTAALLAQKSAELRDELARFYPDEFKKIEDAHEAQGGLFGSEPTPAAENDPRQKLIRQLQGEANAAARAGRTAEAKALGKRIEQLRARVESDHEGEAPAGPTGGDQGTFFEIPPERARRRFEDRSGRSREALPQSEPTGPEPPPPPRNLRLVKPDLSRRIGEEGEGLINRTKEGARSVVSGLRDIAERIQKNLAPATFSDDARATMLSVRQQLGRMDLSNRKAGIALARAYRVFEGMTRKQGLAFLDHAENFSSREMPENLDPRLQRAMLEMRRINAEDQRRLEATGRMKSFIKDYFGHLWKKNDAGQILVNGIAHTPLEGTKSFMKRRTIPTYKEGIERGLEPAQWNPVELFLAKHAEVNRFLFGHAVNKAEIARGARFVPAFADVPYGHQFVNDPSFTVYGPSELAVSEFTDGNLKAGIENWLGELKTTTNRVFKRSGPLGTTEGQFMGPNSGYKGIINVETRFGTPINTLAHELGHVLDMRFGLRHWIADELPKGDTRKAIDARKEAKEQMRALADARIEGLPPEDVTENHRKYLRKTEEKVANLVDAYINTPRLLADKAPFWKNAMDRIIAGHPELKRLAGLQPSLRREELDDTMIPVGGMVTVGRWAVPEGSGAVLSNFLSPGLRGNPAFREALNLGNFLNMGQLGLSGFHGFFTGLESLVTRPMLGLQQVGRGLRGELGEIPRGLGNISTVASGPLAVMDQLIRGTKLRQNILDPTRADEQGKRMAKYFVDGGNHLLDEYIFDRNWRSELVSGVQARQWDRVARAALPAFLQTTAEPLMKHWVPALKAGAFSIQMSDAMRRLGPEATHAQLVEEAARITDEVENRLGQMVYDNHAMNRAMKDVLQLSTRSVGWNLGNVKQAYGAGKDLATMPARMMRIFRGEASASPAADPITSKMAWAVMMPATVALYGGALKYLLTGSFPTTPKGFFYIDTGKKNPDGTAVVLSLPSYMKDYLAAAHGGITHVPANLVTMAGHKASPFASELVDMLNNRDYWGTEIFNPAETGTPLEMAGKRAKELGTYLGKQNLPLSVQNYLKGSEERLPMSERLLSAAGVSHVPRAQTRTNAEDLLYEFQRENTGSPIRSKQQAARAKERNFVIEQLRSGEPLDAEERQRVASDLNEGVISEKDLKTAGRSAGAPADSIAFQRLRPDQALAVYREANPEERARWKPYIVKKVVMGARTYPVADRNEMYGQLRDLLRGGQ